MAQRLKTGDEPSCLTLRVAASAEPVGPEVVVGLASAQHVPGGHDNGVSHGDGGFVGAASGGNTTALRLLRFDLKGQSTGRQASRGAP